MTRRQAAAALLPVLFLVGYILLTLSDPRSLKPLVGLRYPSVHWIDTETLAAWEGSDAPPLLLDVRAPEEFAISRLEGATRIDPGTSDVDLPADRRVVVYCSVGARSAELAAALGGRDVYNLAGGLFAWANEGRPMVSDDGPTDRVHVFSSGWARFLRPRHRAP